MPLPGDLTTVQLTGTFTDSTGNPVRGSVTIAPNATLTDATGEVIIPQFERTYQLYNGTFTSAPMVATSCADISPQGWAYEITVAIDATAPWSFSVFVPYSASPVDLSTLTPTTSSPYLAAYLASTGGALSGTLTLDGSPPLRIATGASSGDVLTSDGSGNATWQAASGAGVELAADLGNTDAAPHVVATHLASPLPVAQGGTNATTSAAALSGLGGAAVAGDIGGTSASPTVAKIQGTAISSPPGGTTSFLAGNGTWQTPAGGVTLDSTSTDIKPLGTQAAGSSTYAAKADHVHPHATILPSGDTSGATDATAVNALVTAGAQEIILGAGQWYFGTNRISLTAGPGIKILGSGSVMNDQASTNATVINAGSSASATGVFFFSHTATLISGTEIGNLDIVYSGTGNVFDDLDLQSGYFHDLNISLGTQGAAMAFAALTSETANNSVIQVTFDRVTVTSAATSRTNPMISLQAENSGGISDVTFNRCKFNNNGEDSAQPAVLVQCTATTGYHYGTAFRDCYFEKPLGGAIKSLSGSGLVVDNCMFWDMTGLTIGGSTVYIGAGSGGSPSQSSRIMGCGRNRTGPDGSSYWDVECESTSSQVLVQGFHILSTSATTQTNAFFNFHGCHDVVLIDNVSPQGSSVNGNSATVVTNPSPTQVTITAGTITAASLAGPDAGSQFFNVMNPAYGAVGDGTTDDTAALKAAITALRANNGGVLFIPPGHTFLNQGGLPVGGLSPGAMIVCGGGWTSQLKLANGANAYIFDTGSSPGTPQYTNGLVIRDLYLACNGANQTAASGGIYAEGCVWGDFDHLYIDTPWEAGIKTYQDGLGNYGHHNTIRASTFINGKNATGTGATGYAILLNSADENYVTGNTFQDCGNSLASENHQVFDKSGLQHFIGNTFVGGATGGTMLKTQNDHSVISGNIFDGGNGADAQVRLNGDKNLVSGNWFYNIGSAAASSGAAVPGLLCDNVQHNMITGNAFIPVASGSGYADSGVKLAYSADYNTVRGNVFTTDGTTGTWQNGAVNYSGGGTHNQIASNDGYAPDLLAPVAVVTHSASPYAASAGQLVPVDTTSGNVTVNLPAAPPDRSVAAVKQVILGSGNSVTVACGGSDVLDKSGGSTSATLTLSGQAKLLQYSAPSAIWYTIADDLPLSQLDGRYLLSYGVSVSSAPSASGLALVSTGTAGASWQAVSGSTGPAGPAGLNWRGAYSGSTTYAANDACQYSGSSFVATAGTTGVSPGSPGSPTSPWSLLAEVGTAVSIDSTSSHILALGTQAAGANGLAADSGHVHPATGVVTGVTAADTSIVVSGTSRAPTIATATLDVIASDHAPAAAVGMNSQKITSLANGSASTDGAAFGQLPVASQINGLLAWNMDIGNTGGNGVVTVAGTVYLLGIYLPNPVTISKVWWAVGTAGASPTGSESVAGIYSSAGTLVASGSASAAVSAAASALASVTMTTPWLSTTSLIWVSFVLQAGTMPFLIRGNTSTNGFVNGNLSASAYRMATNGTGVTTGLPSSITPSSNSVTGSINYWVGIS